MQTSYQITARGLKFALASNQQNDGRSLLFFIIKFYATGSICFDDIKNFYNDNKKQAFKQIYNLLNLQFLTIDEIFVPSKNLSPARIPLTEYFVLSDKNGLTIDYYGFSRQHSDEISTNASDFIRVSRRNRLDIQLTPLCIEAPWQNKSISTCLLFLQQFNCLLSSQAQDIFEHPAFTSYISCLCNRYNYE